MCEISQSSSMTKRESRGARAIPLARQLLRPAVRVLPSFRSIADDQWVAALLHHLVGRLAQPQQVSRMGPNRAARSVPMFMAVQQPREISRSQGGLRPRRWCGLLHVIEDRTRSRIFLSRFPVVDHSSDRHPLLPHHLSRHTAASMAHAVL